MPYCASDVAASLRASRRHFLRHLVGLAPDQWDWKPYPECMSVRETLAHLVCDDRAALEALQTGREPDYAAHQEAERDIEALRGMLDRSHDMLCEAIERDLVDKAIDAEVSAYGAPVKLGALAVILCSEDYYHAGQVAYIRQATDPSWDYYQAIYGD